ncbi:helix-turn-helix domain-containing protein [Priestia koreensis]|uniref:helix-turn-helix domain-containing protein n=2 Tax=Priestia koreensis TaxID=284581 RepID=UPI002040735F|nr:helix-turn-helix transcriptional regulator [Priestia koreensis]MCM3005726.1 helix-turn-helix transcriptional regulator [Priestia koreensis]
MMQEQNIRFRDITIDDDVERLMVLRKRYNLRQYELANALGVSENYLGAIENRVNPLTKKMIRKLDEYLEEMLWR